MIMRVLTVMMKR